MPAGIFFSEFLSVFGFNYFAKVGDLLWVKEEFLV